MDDGHITTHQDVKNDLRASLAEAHAEIVRLTRERDEARASRDSYLKHTQPAVLRRAETAERERDRYKTLAEGERERCALVCSSPRVNNSHWWHIAEVIRALPAPSLPEGSSE